MTDDILGVKYEPETGVKYEAENGVKPTHFLTLKLA
jgi:hypothetical protein